MADGFVRNRDASLGEQIFHITETQAEAVVPWARCTATGSPVASNRRATTWLAINYGTLYPQLLTLFIEREIQPILGQRIR